MAGKLRKMIPEWAKAIYRSLRGWVLSLDLRPSTRISLSDEEREASRLMSIIIPVHDAPKVTLRCLYSLEAFGGEAEVIIVDDGSKLERTKQMLDDFCRQNGWKLVRHDSPQGHSRASEAGVLVSTKPFLCLLNSDTVLSAHSWLGVARAFDSDPQVAVAGPWTCYTPTPQCVSRASKCRHYWSDGQIWRFAEKYVSRFSREPLVDLPMVGGFAFFMRRAVWNEIGGFDKQLPDYGNESELCRRIKQRGYRIVWTKAGYIHHLGSESYGRVFGVDLIRKRCLEADSYINKKWEGKAVGTADR
jgi:GT2 family glycosyltransferase